MKTTNRLMKIVSTRTTNIETLCENLHIKWWNTFWNQENYTSNGRWKCEMRAKTHQSAQRYLTSFYFELNVHCFIKFLQRNPKTMKTISKPWKPFLNHWNRKTIFRFLFWANYVSLSNFLKMKTKNHKNHF